MSNLRVYTNSVFRRHDTGVGHPERASRIDAALQGVERAGLSDRLVGDAALHAETDRIIAKVHSSDYERELEHACRAGMRLFHSVDNPISSQTFAAARTAVGSALSAAQEMLAEESARAFVIARPPGHHADRVAAMGFCFFNTIACVAEWLREREAIDRVFIFDFDVHHGNGTQALFEERDDVYYASIHRFPFYPGTDAAFLRAVEDDIVRVIDDYRPDVLLLSSGFDAHRRDPLGGMNVTEQAYGELTRRMVEAAERHAHGRVLSLLEGGYDLEGLSASVAEHVLALA